MSVTSIVSPMRKPLIVLVGALAMVKSSAGGSPVPKVMPPLATPETVRLDGGTGRPACLAGTTAG
jgi:hypothetical protein